MSAHISKGRKRIYEKAYKEVGGGRERERFDLLYFIIIIIKKQNKIKGYNERMKIIGGRIKL